MLNLNSDFISTIKEHTGWRDKDLSNRHRRWGEWCLSVDIDYLILEFDFAEPKALIDYKGHTMLGKVNYQVASLKAQSTLASNSMIPALVVYYWKKPYWNFMIHSLNRFGNISLDAFDIEADEKITERKYVDYLYRSIRGKVATPSVVLDNCDNKIIDSF